MKTICFLLFLSALYPVNGGVVFSQAPPNGNNFDITDFRLADDFALLAGTAVTQIGFWYQAQEQTDLAAVTYAVYVDNSGALGTLLQSETINSPDTSQDLSSGLFFADFNITPLLLTGGVTYWLELHAGSSLTDTSGFVVSWGSADDNLTQIALQSLTLGLPDTPVGFSGFDQYAFQLSDASSSAPEPASEWLVVFALSMFAVKIRLQRTSQEGDLQ
jgi:hypothetical protein